MVRKPEQPAKKDETLELTYNPKQTMDRNSRTVLERVKDAEGVNQAENEQKQPEHQNEPIESQPEDDQVVNDEKATVDDSKVKFKTYKLE